MKIEVTEKELEAVLACVIIAEDSISNDILMVRLVDKKAIGKVNLDNLWMKLNRAKGNEVEIDIERVAEAMLDSTGRTLSRGEVTNGSS